MVLVGKKTHFIFISVGLMSDLLGICFEVNIVGFVLSDNYCLFSCLILHLVLKFSHEKLDISTLADSWFLLP